jgi:capsid portal protein
MYYGYPEWLSAAPIIDLLRRALQYKSDWFVNRGVLDYIFTLAGSMDNKEWTKVQEFIQQSVGAGRNFKALALKMNQEATSNVHHLSGDGKKEDQFAKDLDTFAQFIVSAHRVPPVLANILIPGKLGASNETIQAIVAFQLLVVGPIQRNIEKTLARTLGDATEGIQGLTAEDFRLVPITSQFDISGLDTIGRSRSEAMDGQNQNRDYSQGVKD